jgi:hypothetical protein
MSIAPSFKLGAAPGQYDQRAEQELRTEMDRRDLLVHKKGRHLDLGGSQFYVVLYSPNGSRWSVTVSNAGALVVTAL